MWNVLVAVGPEIVQPAVLANSSAPPLSVAVTT